MDSGLTVMMVLFSHRVDGHVVGVAMCYGVVGSLDTPAGSARPNLLAWNKNKGQQKVSIVY